MHKRISAFALAMMAIAGVFNLAACGGGSGGTVTVKALTLSPTTANVPLGMTSELTLTVTFTNPSDAASTTPVLTYLVNGVAGGNPTIGTIAPSTNDAQVAVYQAPTMAPGSNNNMVNITATTPVTPGSSTNTSIVTSNTAVLSLTAGTGLTVTPSTAIVGAGGSYQFNAVFNGADTSVTWAVTPSGTENVGTINASTGLYTAPPFPPLGGTVTITGTQDGVTSSAVATITYSAASLKGPFSFSYSGNDKTGFLAAAGSFQADGGGFIVSGVQDTDSFSTGPSAQVPITGTYTVAPDGRGQIKLKSGQGAGTTNTLQFVLSTNQHGLLTRFDAGFTGSGTLDQQNLDALSNSASVVTGPYVFEVGGADTGFNPMGIAGRFTSNGSGTIPNTATVIDVNDNGTIKSSDPTLAGTYAFDPLFPGSGRGTLTLTSNSTGTIQYAFYVVDGTHLRLVEADTNAYLEGDAYSGAVGNSFSAATLANGNYPFVEGGNSPTGLYTAGGIFISDGAGNITGGIFDSNNAGTQTATGGVTMGSCTYSVNQTTSRIDLRLQLASGACGATNGPTTAEFVGYPTAKGPTLLLEVDPIAVASGAALLQTAAVTTFNGNLALGLSGRGVIHNNVAAIQGDVSGSIALTSSTATSGAIDINKFNAVYLNDLINTTTTTIAAPSSPGRGTAVIAGTNPNVTYNVVYYVVSSNFALAYSSDATRNATGFLLQQF